MEAVEFGSHYIKENKTKHSKQGAFLILKKGVI